MEQQINNMKDTANNAARNLKDTAKDTIKDVKQAGSDLAKDAKDGAEGRDWSAKAEQLQSTVRDGIQSGIDSIKGIKADDVKSYAADLGSKAKDLGSDVYADPVGFVKRYPVTAAVGFAAVGFLVGTMIAKSRSES